MVFKNINVSIFDASREIKMQQYVMIFRKIRS